MSKVEQLRSIIKDLPQSTIQGALGSNSVILYNRNAREYAVYCGRLNAEITGKFEQIKQWLEFKRDLILEELA